MSRFSVVTVVIASVLPIAGKAGAAMVRVTVDPINSSIHVGDLATLAVTARVEDAASSGDGIFTYDLDLVLANLSAEASLPVAVMGVHRPGVDDASFGGSDGTASPSGISAIHGGYFDSSVGIGSAATLFTVNVKGVTPGQVSITPGPSVDPYGMDFLLYESASANVVYEPGATITVVPAVPEPAGVAVLLMACHGLLATRALRRVAIRG